MSSMDSLFSTFVSSLRSLLEAPHPIPLVFFFLVFNSRNMSINDSDRERYKSETFTKDQAYGDPTSPINWESEEDSPLMGELSNDQQGISSLTAASNLCLGVLGAGQLTLPFAFASAGLALGIGFLAALGVLSVVVLQILASLVTEYNSVNNFGELLTVTIGPKWRTIANFLLAFYAWGGGISFFLVLKQEWQTLSKEFGFGICGACLLAINCGAVVFPLSLFNNLGKLKITSFLGAFSALCITFSVVYSAPYSEGLICGGVDDSSGIDVPTDTENISLKIGPQGIIPTINALPLMAFALNSAWCYVAILAQQKSTHSYGYEGTQEVKRYTMPSPSEVQFPIWGSTFLILLNYFILSIIGYLSYCDVTNSNILQNLPNSPIVVFARCVLIIQLTLALPLRYNVTRSTVYDEILIHCKDWYEGHPIKEKAVYFVVTLLIVFSACGIAAAVDNLETTVGLTSSICASFVIYIFPALCYRHMLREKEDHSLPKKIGSMMLAAWGLILMVAGVTAIVVSLALGLDVVAG